MRFLKFTFNRENKSINQSMISYYVNHDRLQRINNKPVGMSYNIGVFGKAYGYVVQFEPYQGVKKEKQVASSSKGGLGESVVLWLMECLPPTFSYHIFMNNYFTSFRLLTHLGINNIRATGVLNENRLRRCTIIGDKQPQKNRMWSLWTVHVKQKKTAQIWQ